MYPSSRFVVFTLFLCCLFVLPSCSDPYVLENQVLDCNVEYFASNNEDLSQKIRVVEQQFIADGILKDSTGGSYIELFQKMVDQPEEAFDFSEDSYDLFYDYAGFLPIYYCDEGEVLVDSISYSTSTLKKLIDGFDEFIDGRELTVENVGEMMLSTVTKEDMNQAYYKTAFLSFIVSVNTLSEAAVDLPQSTIEPADSNALPPDVMLISITLEGNVLIDGNPVQMDEIEDYVVTFLSEVDLKRIQNEGLPIEHRKIFTNPQVRIDRDDASPKIILQKVENAIKKAQLGID